MIALKIIQFYNNLLGYNIEAMNEFLPISSFDAVYLVDICESLLDVAKQRFASRGWDNVHVLHQDCAQLVLPEPEWTEGSHLNGSVSFISLSYSLSMVRINCYYYK